MKKKKTEKLIISKLMNRSAVYLFVILMTSIFPLFFMDSSIKLAAAKRTLFGALNIILFIMLFLGGTAWLIERIKEDHKIKISIHLKIGDVFAVMLVIGLMFSTWVSMDRANAFWGIGGKQFGAYLLLLSVLNYFVISRFFKLDYIVIWFYLIGSSITYFLQIANNWGWNVLGVWKNDERFASALGNININAGFDVIMLSIGIGLFFMAEERTSEYIYGIYIFIGFAGLLCCRSDLGVAGIAAAFIVSAWYKIKEKESYIKFMILVVLFGMAAGCVSLGRYFGSKYMFQFDSFVAFLTTPYVSLLIIIIGVIMMMAFYWVKKVGSDEKKFVKMVHKAFFAVIFLGMAIIVILVLMVNTVLKDSAIPNWLEMIRFNDSFASERGYVWKRTLIAYFQSPWIYKIFGFGTNCFTDLINPMFYEEMVSTRPTVFVDAHNEFLQMLTTTGVLGVIGFFGLKVSSLVLSIKNIHRSKAAIIPAIVICSDLMMGIFYSPNIFVTPLVFIFLGIVEAERRNSSISSNA